MSLQTFSTLTVDPQYQFEYWNDAICRVFTQLSAQPFDLGVNKNSGYEASLENWNLGELQFSKVIASAALVDHGKLQIAASSDDYDLVHMQIKGSSLNKQDGRESVLCPGEFTICNSTRPYSVTFNQSIEMFVLRVPRSRTADFFYPKKSFYGLHFGVKTNENTSSLFTGHLKNLWQQRNNPWSETQLSAISNSVMALMNCHLDNYRNAGMTLPERASSGLFNAIKLYIDQHSDNFDLSSESVASAFNISSRTLRSRFAAQGITFSNFLLECRLLTAKKLLSDPQYQNSKIIDVALECGFQSASHFSSCFRDFFGQSPSDYRQQNLGIGAEN